MEQAPGTVYSSLVNADLTFDPIKGSNEEELEVTGGSFIPLMQSPDRNVRKAAFESLYGGYGKVLNTAAGLLNAQVSQTGLLLCKGAQISGRPARFAGCDQRACGSLS